MEHPLFKSRDYLLSQSVLEKSISGKANCKPANSPWNRILFTGGTGFIGGYLIKEILDGTQADICCLIRCSSEREGKERLISTMQEKGIWKEAYDPRLQVIIGDLNQPKLGLSDETRMYLAENIDVIFHLGASVNWISSYTSQAKSNVWGFIELLKLATLGRTIPIHYTSSMCVYASAKKYPGEPILEDEIFQDPESLYGGYCQSKWVCEKMIEQARKRNVPINVYRIGEVTGDSQTGLTDPKNFVNLLIFFCIMTQMAPDAYRTVRFNLLPVDYVSKAVFYIAKHMEGTGRNFQLNSTQICTLEEMVKEMNRCGFGIRWVTSDAWEKVLNEPTGSAKIIKPIFRKLNINEESREVSFFDIGQQLFLRHHDTTNTDQVLNGSGIGCGGMIDQGIFQSYCDHILKNMSVATL